jgi:putative addiction module component (TIGR02574 family)
MSVTIEQFGIDRLSEVERLDLLAAIWDSLPADLPLPDWHRDELARRIADADADPSGGSPWAEVKARLRSGS